MSKVVKAFLVGGCMGIVTQLFLMLWAAVLGPGSPLVGPAALVTLGVLALVLVPTGLYVRLEKFGGWGVMLTFTGLAAAVAGTFSQVKGETGSAASGIAAGFKLVFAIVGAGAVAFVVVDLFCLLVQ